VKPFRNVVDGEVRFWIPANSPCPCGSGQCASQCCLTPTGFHKVPASTAPPPPKTGDSFEWCYASPLADCSSKRSREHYFSESLLHYLNRNKDLRVTGLPWVEGEVQVVPPSALASRVLCKRHNSALSPLDAIAVRLFKALDEEGAAGSSQQLLYLFSGHDLERWLLKILCGITCSRNLPLDLKAGLVIPKNWLDILFGDTEFPDEQGLYVCKSPGHRFEGPRGLQLRVIIGRGRLTGMGLWVCGYELILSMSGFPSRSFDGRNFAYRPLEFYTTGRDFEKSVLFSWDGAADLGTVSLEIGGT
jgi:hypothetical protein